MRGISPIVAVVLLIAISVIASVGVWYWVGTLTEKKATPNAPAVLQAQHIGVETVENIELSKVLVQNIGTGTVKSKYVFVHTTTSGPFGPITFHTNLEYIPTTKTKYVSGRPYGLICIITYEGGIDKEGNRATISPNGQVTCTFYNITGYSSTTYYGNPYTINESVGLFLPETTIVIVPPPIKTANVVFGEYDSSG